MFIFGGFAASAAVGAFISGLRILAYLGNVSGTQPISETGPNFGINVGVVAICAWLLRLDVKRGNENLGRLSRGAQLAALKIKLAITGANVSLGSLRGKKRVVILIGEEGQVMDCMKSAKSFVKQLEEYNLIVVPFVEKGVEGGDGKVERIKGSWSAEPVGGKEWEEWVKVERKSAAVFKKAGGKGGKGEEDRDPMRAVVVRMDGKVGGRSLGPLAWHRLIDSMKRLPERDRYGRP